MVRLGRLGKLMRRARKANQVVATGPKKAERDYFGGCPIGGFAGAFEERTVCPNTRSIEVGNVPPPYKAIRPVLA